jgi:hypothetical protein
MCNVRMERGLVIACLLCFGLACGGDQEPTSTACNFGDKEPCVCEDGLAGEKTCTAGGALGACECEEICEGGCDAPANTCDGETAVAYSGNGLCDEEARECDFSMVATRTDCMAEGNACQDGACVDPCTTVDCSSPGDRCMGNMLLTYTGSGMCDPATGACDFSAVETATDCTADGRSCEDGACSDVGTTCDTPNPPDRCSEDPDDFEWGPASVLNVLMIEGSDCCFDYTGDGTPDNALGGLLAPLMLDADLNAGIAASIQAGEFLILFEFAKMESLESSNFRLNFYFGAYDNITRIHPNGNNALLVKEESIDSGTHPKYSLSGGSLVANEVTAGPGNALLELELLKAKLRLPIQDTRISASLLPDQSGLPDQGLGLAGGRLGAVVRAQDMAEALNEFARGPTCECLELPGDMITIEDSTTFACNNTGIGSCAENSDCAVIAQNCSLIVGVVPIRADIDTDGDGTNDALTVGASFTAAGAKITGLKPDLNP